MLERNNHFGGWRSRDPRGYYDSMAYMGIIIGVIRPHLSGKGPLFVFDGMDYAIDVVTVIALACLK